MSCGTDKKPDAPKEESSGGFFSWLFGGSSSGPEEKRSTLCPGGCGMEQCNCNCALREHLKECCGYGQLPALITKNTCPVPKRVVVVEEVIKNDDCVFPPVQTTCEPPAPENAPPATACSAQNEKKKCSLPDTDTSCCVPNWVCPPVQSTMRTYSAPVGVVVLPISVKAKRYATQGNFPSKCGECGTETKVDAAAVPKVANKECPMIKVRCPDKAAEEKKLAEANESVFAKIGAIFSGKANEFGEICQQISAAATAPEEDCDCDDCVNKEKENRIAAVRQSFKKCCQTNNAPVFRNPSQCFGDFQVPPGTEGKRGPKVCKPVPKPQPEIPADDQNCPEVVASSTCSCCENDSAESPQIKPEDPSTEIETSTIPETSMELEPKNDNCCCCEQAVDAVEVATVTEPVEDCPPPEENFDCECEQMVESENLSQELPADENCLEMNEEDDIDSVIAQDEEDCDPDPNCVDYEEVEDNVVMTSVKVQDCCQTGRVRVCESDSVGLVLLLPSNMKLNKYTSVIMTTMPEGKLQKDASCSCGEVEIKSEKKVECADPIPKQIEEPLPIQTNLPVKPCPEPIPKNIEACPEPIPKKIGACPEPIPKKIEDCPEIIQSKVAACPDPIAKIEVCEPVAVAAVNTTDVKTEEATIAGPPAESQIAECLPVAVATVETTEVKMEEATCAEPAIESQNAECKPIAETPPATCEEPPKVLSKYEEAKKSILDSVCKCQSCNEARGCPPEEIPIRKSSCGRCGENRGENDSCPLCRFVANMRNSCPPAAKAEEEVTTPEDNEEECDCLKCSSDACYSDLFHTNSSGKPVYEGGMCLTRATYYLWKTSAGPTFKDLAFDGQAFKGFGVPGESTDGDDMECTCEEHMRMMEEKKAKGAYNGGMNLSEAEAYLWARPEPK